MTAVQERNCAACHQPLSPTQAALGMMSHPGCTVPNVDRGAETSGARVDENPFDLHDEKVGGVPLPGLADDLQAEFMTMVRRYEEFTPRATQAHLGPSDLGGECDRRLGYKIAGVRGHHVGDPWPAAVGSAIHAYFENIVRKYGREYGGAWLIEHKVIVDPNVRGSADLVRAPLVVDLKSAGKDMMDKVRKQGPPLSYKRQINLYAKGLIQEGHKIEQVAFVFVPRSGWLRDMYVWAAPVDLSIADEALARAYGIAEKVMQLDVLGNPHRWEQVPATPSYLCNWCPMFDKHRTAEEGADGRGCPGLNK